MWAVVPVKPFAEAKRRLANDLRPVDRRALVAAMLADVLQVLRRAEGLEGVLVVTRGHEEAAMTASLGATILEERDEAGLNAALEQAARHLVEAGAKGMMVVPGDVPALKLNEVEAVLEGHLSGDALTTIVADRHGRGTNCLACTPVERCMPRFGVESFLAHRSLADDGGGEVRVLELPGLQFDIDTMADLQEAMEQPLGHRTRRVLTSLGLGQRELSESVDTVSA